MHTAHLSPIDAVYECFEVTLPDTCAEGVIRGIHHVADTATEMMLANPYRWQYRTLYVAEAAPDYRTAAVRRSPYRLIGIFSQLPTYGNPTGTRLFVVGFLDDCHCRGGCQGRGHKPLQVQVRWVSGFPLEFEEARYEFCRQFGIVPWQECGTHPVWLPPAAPPAPPAAPEPEPPAKARPGAPLAVPTQKLLEAMEPLDDPCDNRHLKPQYVTWCVEHNGQAPGDPDASFRKAVQICLRVLEERRRKAGDAAAPHT